MTHMPQHFATSDFKILRRARCFNVFTTLYCNKKKNRKKNTLEGHVSMQINTLAQVQSYNM